MFNFQFKAYEAQKKSFSELNETELFCHSTLPSCIFMKKIHEIGGNEYQAIDLQNGDSLPNSLCFPLTVNATVTLTKGD